MEPALRLRSVRQTFGSAVAVDGLDLAVPAGALYGVIGPNGAGKTTTIRLIMSILFPDSGEMSVLGHRSALEAKTSSWPPCGRAASSSACCCCPACWRSPSPPVRAC
jgi:ABC-type multidrug transport system ATPase subunit